MEPVCCTLKVLHMACQFNEVLVCSREKVVRVLSAWALGEGDGWGSEEYGGAGKCS